MGDNRRPDADGAVAEADRLLDGPRVVAQRGGDLGARMVRAMRTAGTRPVVVIGSDVPDITPPRIAAAFRALGRAPFVLGATTDGGYWLIGARHPERLRRDALSGVRWSTAHARADSIARLGAESVAILPFELEDIDDAAAYRRWRTGVAKRNSV